MTEHLLRAATNEVKSALDRIHKGVSSFREEKATIKKRKKQLERSGEFEAALECAAFLMLLSQAKRKWEDAARTSLSTDRETRTTRRK